MKTIDVNDLQVKLARQFMKHVKGRNLPLDKRSAEELRAIADSGVGTYAEGWRVGTAKPWVVLTVCMGDPGIEGEARINVTVQGRDVPEHHGMIVWLEPPIVKLQLSTNRRCRDMQGHSASSASFERQCIDTLKLLEKMTNDALEGGIDGTLCVSCKVKTPG